MSWCHPSISHLYGLAICDRVRTQEFFPLPHDAQHYGTALFEGMFFASFFVLGECGDFPVSQTACLIPNPR